MKYIVLYIFNRVVYIFNKYLRSIFLQYKQTDNFKIFANNNKAYFNYEILDMYEYWNI